MYHVLVPVDRNVNRARHQAQYVARLPDAESAVVATVLYVAPPDRFASADEVSFAEIDAAVAATNDLESAGVEVEKRVDDGSVAAAIAGAIENSDVDEVVMGGRKRSGVTAVLLGSVARDVMLATDRPVTITGQQVSLGDGVRRVLVPIDRSEARARRQVEYVTNLPGAPESVAAVVYYVFPHQDYAGAPPHEFAEVEAAVATADALETAGIEVERVAEGGEVTRRILATAEERGVDGIVMGGRKRSGIQQVLLGSTVQDVMLSADRPVTLIG